MELTQAITIATNLLNQYGLTTQGWTALLGRGATRLGLCNYRRKVIKVARHHVLNATDAEVMDTIRHEIAHALAGPAALHGPLWQSWALKVGANPRSHAKIKYQLPLRYMIVCGKCNRTLQRRINKMSARRLSTKICKNCGLDSLGHLTLKNYNASTTSSSL